VFVPLKSCLANGNVCSNPDHEKRIEYRPWKRRLPFTVLIRTSAGEVDPSEGEGRGRGGWDGAYGIRGWGVVALGGTVGGGVLRSEIVEKRPEDQVDQGPAPRGA